MNNHNIVHPRHGPKLHLGEHEGEEVHQPLHDQSIVGAVVSVKRRSRLSRIREAGDIMHSMLNNFLR